MRFGGQAHQREAAFMNNNIGGFDYIDNFISVSEEHDLAAAIRPLSLERLRIRGMLTHRSVASFGLEYDGRRRNLTEAPPIPDTFAALRVRVAEHVALPPERLRSALVTEYPAKAKIGMHQDNPSYGSVICGVSLLSAAVMTLEHDGRTDKLEIRPRSLYVLRGPARWYRHEVVARGHRYSITLRTIAAEELDAREGGSERVFDGGRET
jgi:alkylated DNA repair dioxygenase AlkB